MRQISSKLKLVGIVVGLTMAGSLAAEAATLNGRLDIAGNVNTLTSDFSSIATGHVDLYSPGIVTVSQGDFSSFVATGASATLNTNVHFSATPVYIWTVGGFTFTATSFFNLVNQATLKAFDALGTITGNGFDATEGTLYFTSQGPDNYEAAFSTSTIVPLPGALLLFGSGLAGLGFLSRKRKKAATLQTA